MSQSSAGAFLVQLRPQKGNYRVPAVKSARSCDSEVGEQRHQLLAGDETCDLMPFFGPELERTERSKPEHSKKNLQPTEERRKRPLAGQGLDSPQTASQQLGPRKAAQCSADRVSRQQMLPAPKAGEAAKPPRGCGMTGFSRWTMSSSLLSIALLTMAQAPSSTPESRGVRCPDSYQAVFDAAEKSLRCRKDIVRWVVTGCANTAFASYIVKSGPDSCGPTEIPGVGTPPGVKGSRPVTCAAPGYELMVDRTGQRDRCERTERLFVFPLPTT